MNSTMHRPPSNEADPAQQPGLAPPESSDEADEPYPAPRASSEGHIGRVVAGSIVAGLVATGLLRLIFGLGLGTGRSRTMVVLAGVVTLLLGLLILAGRPGHSLVVLGALLGADLLSYGVGWRRSGFALRSISGGQRIFEYRRML